MSEEKVEMKESYKKKLAKKDEEIEKTKTDMEHWKNEYYKAYADMANLRKDIERDHKEVIKYRLEGFISNIMGILDAFDMAFRVEPTNPETKNYLQGFKYVHSSLLNALSDEGVTVISPKAGDKFNEKDMEAVDTVEDEGEPNIVKTVTMTGYRLHDHLVRPAMVVVTKKPAPVEEKETEAEETKENVEENVENTSDANIN